MAILAMTSATCFQQVAAMSWKLMALDTRKMRVPLRPTVFRCRFGLALNLQGLESAFVGGHDSGGYEQNACGGLV